MNLAKKQVQCFIDGFNLYHAIDDLRPRQEHLKWVNLSRLASAFIKPSQENLTAVFYFTAYANWRPAAKSRHEQYVKANRYFGVTPILGHFKKKDQSCNKCNATWISHEEKASDVNIAIYLVHQAHLGLFDKALVISADSDLCPAIRMVLDTFPDKQIEILTPPNRYQITRELRDTAATAHKIKLKHLRNNRLPDIVEDTAGNLIALRPNKYSP